MEDILKSILEVLKKMNDQKAALTIKEAADYSNIGENKIRELLISDVNFPFFRVGKKALINKQAFDLWLNEITANHKEI